MSIFIKAGLWASKKTGYKGELNLTELLTATPVVVPYKVYTALLTHANGASAPVAGVLENTLGGTINWTYSSTGRYTGTLLNAFTPNKTTFLATIDNTKNLIIGGSSTSINTIGISIIDGNSGLYTNASFQTITIEIKVYN